MFYDYDDYWEEPNEFEQQIEEFKDALRKNVRDEIKERIESLEKELSELKAYKDDKNKIIQEYENKVREAKSEAETTIRKAKESEEKWKKARLHQLLGDYLTVGWKAVYTRVYGEKCDKCDDDRKIHFSSPQGKKYTEDCQCAKCYYKYHPKEATLAKIHVRKKHFDYDDKGKCDFYNRYYKVEDADDYDIYETSSEVYTSSDFDYEKANPYRAVFLNEEDCAKYCEWLTEKSLKNMFN